jgi:hypothetical protein
LNTIATELSVSPEQLEFFLFEFGLNLKPSAQPGAQEGRFVGKPASRP